jgi:hypothetical protein
MKKELGTTGASIGATVLACLFGGLALAIYPGWAAFGRWAERADAPAWVQAVGSVAAILAAIGIAAWQRHADKETEKKTARATVMVVGASTDSKVHTLIATATAMLAEHSLPGHPTAVERARHFQILFAKAELPTEEQMLLLAGAVPNAAATMANGVAALKKVILLLDYVVSAPTLTTLNEKNLLGHYLSTRHNLVMGLKYLESARAELLAFANEE